MKRCSNLQEIASVPCVQVFGNYVSTGLVCWLEVPYRMLLEAKRHVSSHTILSYDFIF